MAKKESTKTTVRRIKAVDDTPKKPGTTIKSTKIKRTAPSKTTLTRTSLKTDTSTSEKPPKRSRTNPFTAIGGYFRGAWRELKMVRWPTRSATWSMTLAVLVFTLVFAGVILLLDAGFNWAFEQLLRK